MTGTALARRLLARLMDEQAIETEPIAEVRADLAALGIDPSRTIALSRRLAGQAHSPAAALLRRISASEEDDDEIRRLEQADIDAVRRTLPEGATAAATARARRAAGSDSNVVGLRSRRSRRLLYGLSGVAAAMAASLVFYVGLSSNQPLRLQTSHEAPESTVAQQQFSGGGIQAANEPAASGTQSAAQAPAAATPTPSGTDDERDKTVRLRRDEQAVADSAELRREAKELAKSVAGAGATGSATTVKESERTGAQSVAVDAAAPTAPAAPFGLAHPVVALLIVDPGSAPPSLRQEDYPTGNLLARLGEARRLAEGRPVVALVTLRMENRNVDAIISESSEGKSLSRGAAVSEVESTTLGPLAPGYELIELDRR